jgi:hypothetical protein
MNNKNIWYDYEYEYEIKRLNKYKECNMRSWIYKYVMK